MDNSEHSRIIQVSEEYNNSRLDSYLSKVIPDYSRSRLQKLIDSGNVFLNGNPHSKRTKVHTGDKIKVDLSVVVKESNFIPEPQNIDLEILYEDDYFVAINKQAGLVVHPGSGNRDGTLVNAILYHIPNLSDGNSVDRPGIVHRLDKNTSGVIIIAKSNDAHVALSKMFAERNIYKEYIGLCTSNRPPNHEIINAPIGRSRSDPVKLTVKNDGKDSKTEYWLERYYSGISIIKFVLHTGRTHQIRVHCKYAGMPIVSDDLYGGGRLAVEKRPSLERPFAYGIHKVFSRQALHSKILEFEHPFTKRNICIEAPLPNDFNDAFLLFDKADGKYK